MVRVASLQLWHSPDARDSIIPYGVNAFGRKGRKVLGSYGGGIGRFGAVPLQARERSVRGLFRG
jgi:hypothetical protein